MSDIKAPVYIFICKAHCATWMPKGSPTQRISITFHLAERCDDSLLRQFSHVNPQTRDFEFEILPLPSPYICEPFFFVRDPLSENPEGEEEETTEQEGNGDQHWDHGCGLLRRQIWDSFLDQLNSATQSLQSRRGYFDPISPFRFNFRSLISY